MFTARDIIIFCIGLALALSVCLMIGWILGARRQGKLIRRDANRATLNAQARLRQVDGDFVLVAGDSTVAHLVLSPIADLPVIEVALLGLTSGEFHPRITQILSGRRPRITVLSIGANDALQKGASEATRTNFKENLRKIANAVEGREATFILSLPRIDTAAPDYAHGAAAMESLNRDANAFARAHRWIYVDGAQICDAADHRGEPMSVDGLHLTPDASREIAQALRRRIAAVMDMNSKKPAPADRPFQA
ncbi:lysophospholipase L1-like esterase [Beijerinckia sp. GAS462]|nr:lysophospholipase L1-like esterase [Beijerinckia sp. GAS462]SEB46502.1 Lysophospholipase L1 [Beijerinckia sp. 28-YEA-48]